VIFTIYCLIGGFFFFLNVCVLYLIMCCVLFICKCYLQIWSLIIHFQILWMWRILCCIKCNVYGFMICPISFSSSKIALMYYCIGPYVMNLSVTNSRWQKNTSCKQYLYIRFFSSIDCNVFFTMSILKSSIIIVGQSIDIFWRIVFKWKWNKVVAFLAGYKL